MIQLILIKNLNINIKNISIFFTQAIPTMNAKYEETMVLKELIGVPYTDAKWDRFLDQMSLTEMLDLFKLANNWIVSNWVVSVLIASCHIHCECFYICMSICSNMEDVVTCFKFIAFETIKILIS